MRTFLAGMLIESISIMEVHLGLFDWMGNNYPIANTFLAWLMVFGVMMCIVQDIKEILKV